MDYRQRILPPLGVTGNALCKNSNADFDVGWYNLATIPIGGATGTVLGKASAADFDVTWITLPNAALLGYNVLTKSADQDVTNSSVLVDAIDLTFPVTAGHFYHLLGLFIISCFDVNSALRLVYATAGNHYGNGAKIGTITAEITSNGTPASTVLSCYTSMPTFNGRGLVQMNYVVSPVGNDNLKVQFANFNAGVGRVSRLCKNSLLYWKDVT
jgi:hypothetical protein